jgi:hypothetical protein
VCQAMPANEWERLRTMVAGKGRAALAPIPQRLLRSRLATLLPVPPRQAHPDLAGAGRTDQEAKTAACAESPWRR